MQNKGKQTQKKTSKKWNHLQKYKESFGKFQSLLDKCASKVKTLHNSSNEVLLTNHEDHIIKPRELIDNPVDKPKHLDKSINNSHNQSDKLIDDKPLDEKPIDDNKTIDNKTIDNKIIDNHMEKYPIYKPIENVNKISNFSSEREEKPKYTVLNKSLAFQLVKDFEDLRLLKKYSKTHKNNNSFNTSNYINTSRNFSLDQDLFDTFKRNQQSVGNVKKELIELDAINQKLIWSEERERKSAEKKEEFQQNLDKMRETFDKEKNFKQVKSIETSKERKEILEKNKKEIIALKKVKKLNEELENSKIIEEYKENLKTSLWKKEQIEKIKKKERNEKKLREKHYAEIREIKELQKTEQNIKTKDDILRYKIESCLNEDLKFHRLFQTKEDKRKELQTNLKNLHRNSKNPSKKL